MHIPFAQPRRVATIALFALAAMFVPSAAHGQLLRKIKDAAKAKAADVAADKAADKVLGPDSANAAAPAAAPSSSAGRRNGNQLEITTERIDALIAAIQPLADERERAAKADKAWRDYEASRDGWSKCYHTTIQGANAAALVQQFDEAAMEKANQRMQKASAAMQTSMNDTVRMAALQAELEEAGFAFMAAQYPSVAKKCGASPGKRPEFADRTYRSQDANVQRIAQQHGIDRYQLGLMRERVAAWLLSDGQLSGSYAGVKVSDAEAQALSSRRAELARFASLFKDGTLPWTHWTDLGSW